MFAPPVTAPSRTPAAPEGKGGARTPARRERAPITIRPGAGWDLGGGAIFPPAPRLPLQAKLAVGAIDDPWEREADRVAAQVMRMPAPLSPAPLSSTPPQISRKCAACEEEDRVQRRSTTGAPPALTAAPPIVHDVLRTPGRPLDTATRAYFEPRFGHDFSAVRVHADARASASARAIGARAYTVGSSIVLGAGAALQDRPLLAHELAHVVQQTASGTGHAQRRVQRQPEGDGSATPPDATKQFFAHGTVMTAVVTIHREGLYARLVTTMDTATWPPRVTQRLFRRDDSLNPEWTEVTREAARDGTLSVEWRMPTLRTDEEIARNIQGPGLLYGLMPFHVMPYLKDQTLPIRNPHTRMMASATQQTERAVDKVTGELALYALQTGAELGPAATGLAGAMRGAGMLTPAASTGSRVVVEGAEAADVATAAAPGQRVVQTSSDRLVRDSTFAMANRTGHAATPLASGSLQGAREATVVGHGLVTPGRGAAAIDIGGTAYTPKAFAGELADAGWEGGTLRLAACQTGTSCLYNYTFGQELANELEAMGLDTVVIVPEGNVNVLQGAHGLPQVTGPGGTLQPPGQGWSYLLGE